MKQSLNIGKEPDFQKIIIASAVLHILFISLIIVPIKTKEREYKSYFVNIVGPAEIQRANKSPALDSGRKDKRRAVKAKKALKQRVKPKSKADISLEPTKRVAKEIERLRAIKALSERRNKKGDDAAREIEVIKKKTYGNVSRAPGIPGRAASADSDSYYARVTQQIWSEWIYPDFDSKGLEVVISIQIGVDGKVISQEIEKSSGNLLFDRSATKAILKASPLPPPPVEMEIGVRFYL